MVEYRIDLSLAKFGKVKLLRLPRTILAAALTSHVKVTKWMCEVVIVRDSPGTIFVKLFVL